MKLVAGLRQFWLASFPCLHGFCHLKRGVGNSICIYLCIAHLCARVKQAGRRQKRRGNNWIFSSGTEKIVCKVQPVLTFLFCRFFFQQAGDGTLESNLGRELFGQHTPLVVCPQIRVYYHIPSGKALAGFQPKVVQASGRYPYAT